MQRNPGSAPKTANGMANPHKGIHWRTAIAACVLGLLLAAVWVEVAEGGKGMMHALWTLLP